jgi:hypothetical protein
MRNLFASHLSWGLGSLTFATLIVLTGATASACSSSSAPNTETDSGGKSPDAASGEDVAAGDVSSDAPAPTWNNFAKGFFATYCVSCHNATTPDAKADPEQNFNIYADVVAKDATIRCGVAPMNEVQSGCPTTGFPPPHQFPIGTGPHPSDAERLRIIAWINAKAPEN